MIGSQNFVTETYVVIMKFQTSLENGYLKCLQEKKTKKFQQTSMLRIEHFMQDDGTEK